MSIILTVGETGRLIMATAAVVHAVMAVLHSVFLLLCAFSSVPLSNTSCLLSVRY